MNRSRVCASTCLLVCGILAADAFAYTLLGFPSDASVQVGGGSRWQVELDQGAPSLSLSYAIESTFLSNVPGARDATLSALHSWDAVSGPLTLSDAGYEPVVNSSNNWFAVGGNFEGPAGSGIGANIDIMSRPTGFSFSWFGKTHQFDPNTLGFTVPTVMGGNILSVDIYLNSDFNWSTTGGDFDIETVILHELGHAFGLDHPDQAAANGAANYDPFTHEPGAPWSTDDVMHSTYYPDGINRTLGDDEIGGLSFLYGGLAGDANLDNQFDFADVQLAIDMYFGFAEEPSPATISNIDFGGTPGVLDFSDVDKMILSYFYPEQQEQASQGFTVDYLQGMGYDITVPEPHTATLFLAVFGAFAMRRPTAQEG